MSIPGKDNAIEEILKLLSTQPKEEGEIGFTKRDLEGYLNCGTFKANKIIDNLLKEKLIEPVRMYRTNRIGIVAPFMGYKLTAKAQDKAAAQS